jgi:hypothetical protein
MNGGFGRVVRVDEMAGFKVQQSHKRQLSEMATGRNWPFAAKK